MKALTTLWMKAFMFFRQASFESKLPFTLECELQFSLKSDQHIKAFPRLNKMFIKATRTPLKTGDEFRCFGKIAVLAPLMTCVQ
jgi:hypothetical protein